MKNIQITSDIVTIDGIQYKRVIAEAKEEYPKIVAIRSNHPSEEGVIITYNGEQSVSRSDGLTCSCISLSAALKVDFVEIYSVAKSENEVFTVGDETQHGKITGFLLGEDGPGIYVSIEGYETIKWNVMDLLKAPERKPLFTTEDGVEIYEDGEYWIVDKDLYLENKVTKIHRGTIAIIKRFPENKRFSTREAAEAYIRENKPEFSRKQIREAIEKAGENFRNVCHKATIKDILGL